MLFSRHRTHGLVSQKHLLHSHTWVRQAASRLWGVYFAARDPAAVLASPEAGDYLAQPHVLFQVSKHFCEQLEGGNVPRGLSAQLVKNFFFVGRAMFPLFKVEHEQTMLERRQEKRSDKGGHLAKQAAEIDSEDDVAAEEAGEEVEPEAERQRSGLLWTYKQLVFVARQEAINTPQQTERRECIFKWFAAMLQHMRSESDVLPRFLLTMVRALYRTEECTKSPDTIRMLAGEVSHLIKEVVGTSAYLATQAKAEQEVTQARATRKRKIAQDVITQPALVSQQQEHALIF